MRCTVYTHSLTPPPSILCFSQSSTPMAAAAAAFLLAAVLFAIAAPSSATWCVCREGISESNLQRTIDYACGAGADCNPTHQNGPCFNPNTVRAHCNYAVNSYFQRNRQVATACDFSGTASIVTSDPSTTGCSFPSTASSTTPTTINGGTTTGGNNNTPLITTPSGVLGGGNNGLGPSGNSNDFSHGGNRVMAPVLLLSSMILAFSVVVLW